MSDRWGEAAGQDGGRWTEVAQLMTLLSERAPTRALEEWTHRWAQRVGCTGPAERQTLRGILEVRDVLTAQQRTQERYRALYATAHDLTRLRNVDRVLEAIVQRARSLLDCDVAYLDTDDDGKEEKFTVRALAGQASPQFRGIPVTSGQGVGGTVVQTRRAFQVADYQYSDAFPHRDELDSHMRQEGLVALLGVPLEVDGRLVGILFAGRRRAVEFTAQEQDLLASLAAHAAVALDNATLFHAQEAALSRLEQANALVREHNAAIEREAELHARLTRTLLEDGDPQRIVTQIAATLGARVTLVEPDRATVISSAGPAGPDAAGGGFGEQCRPVTESGQAGGCSHEAEVRSGNQVLGYLLLASGDELSQRDLLTFERSAQTVAVAMLTEVTLVEADRRAAGELLRQLLSTPQPAPNTLAAAGRRHRLNTGPMHVLVAELPPQQRSRTLSVAERLCRQHGGLSAELDGHLIAVVPSGSDGDDVAAQFRRTLTSSTGAESGQAQHFGELPALYLEAYRCVQLMPAIGRAHTWASTTELGMYSMLFTASAASGIDHFLEARIGQVLDYDARHQSHLCETARAYLDAASSPRTAAAELGVHANTVMQRLNRIDRLLGKEWRSGPRNLEIHTALRLQALRARV